MCYASGLLNSHGLNFDISFRMNILELPAEQRLMQ